MFEGITQGLKSALSFIDRGRLTEANIREGMQQVRLALLEADVNYEVAQEFVDRVTAEAIGDRVLKSVRPSEQIVGVVYEELVRLMGPVDPSIPIRRDELTVLMMCGLQGSGKTTTCGKLARLLQKEGVKPMLVAADLQRPAAIEQLKVIGEQIDVPVYSEPPDKSTPLQVCLNAKKAAQQQGCNVLILDTAGRLHVDDALMRELEEIDRKVMPHQALLVCDAMTGQDAVKSAKAFNEALEIDGVILTKLDGDTRGGAALSVKAVTGVPIKFIGVGEQLDRLEPFRPEGMADRILGMGDIVGLVQRAQAELDQEEMAEQQQKMLQGRFTLVDFQKQMRQIRKLGPMREIMKMIPGLGNLFDAMGDDIEDPEREMARIDAIINAMTPDERLNPDRIDRSRRNRIAKGSGTTPADVNGLLKQFDQMAKMMKEMAGMGIRDRMRAVQQMANSGALSGAPVRREKQRSKRGPLDATKLKQQKKKQRKDARKAKKRNRRR